MCSVHFAEPASAHIVATRTISLSFLRMVICVHVFGAVPTTAPAADRTVTVVPGQQGTRSEGHRPGQ
jgi:hypothetical protein